MSVNLDTLVPPWISRDSPSSLTWNLGLAWWKGIRSSKLKRSWLGVSIQRPGKQPPLCITALFSLDEFLLSLRYNSPTKYNTSRSTPLSLAEYHLNKSSLDGGKVPRPGDRYFGVSEARCGCGRNGGPQPGKVGGASAGHRSFVREFYSFAFLL